MSPTASIQLIKAKARLSRRRHKHKRLGPLVSEIAQDMKGIVALIPRHENVIMEITGNDVGAYPALRQGCGNLGGEAVTASDE
jgi:hypothetical protein